jgi:hypothetical protein
MAATGHPFPNLTPSQRVYLPGTFPANEFQGLNGAVTTIQYGSKPVDSQLQMTFQNITDDEAYLIYDNYIKANGGKDVDTGERDFVSLSSPALAGIYSSDLQRVIGEQNPSKLRYRYVSPPQITSVFPGISTVTVELRGYLEGANSV